MASMQCMHRGASVYVRLIFFVRVEFETLSFEQAGQMTLNREIPLNLSDLVSFEQIDMFINKLDESVKARVSNIPSNVGRTQGAK